MSQFTAGKTYATRSVCDHDCIITVTIQKRTPSTVQAVVRGELKVFRIGQYDGVEFIKPWGNYSMCPILRASDAQ